MLRTLALFTFCSAALFAQAPTVAAVYNAYSYSTTLCPGLLAVVTGTNFGTNASNVTVTVGTKPAYVYAGDLSATAMVVEIPFELSPGATTLIVTVSGTPSAAFPVTLAAVSPAFETPNSSATGLASVYNATTNAAITYAAPAHPGDTLTAYAVGLGVTSPATPTGAPAAGNPVSPLPKITVGGVGATVLFAGTTSAGGGIYQINFTVPSSGVQGTEPLVITIGGASSSSTIDVALVGLSAVVVNGSFANAGTIAPGSIGTVFANGLGSASTNQVSLFPATQSEGVQVTFNGTAAPMYHLLPQVSPQQIDLFVPSELPTSGTVNVQLTTSSANYPNYTLNMVPASPSMFRFTDPKTGNAFAIAEFANTAWVVLPATATANIGFPACTASTSAATECGQPANIGDNLSIYLTGLGLATPNGNPNGTPLPTGQIPPLSGNPLYETPTLPTVTIGGIQAPVLFSGLTPGFPGEYQLVVTVPAGVASGDSVPLKITMLGLSDTANISIQPTRVAAPQ